MKFTITTPLYYVNAYPHIGSTYTTIATDAIARYRRLVGDDVFFITGVDEHGQKIQRTAENNNLDPIDHCNNIVTQYKNLWNNWNISHDYFIRTTSDIHKKVVYAFYDRVLESGDIYLGQQKGWYCVGCEEFKDININDSDSDSDSDKKCSIHQKNLEWRDETNLFFKLSKYQKDIEELVSSNGFIQPISRRNEIINFVSKGLKDFSISRVNLDWGIPVPNHKGHTFYVWFDALLGYITSVYSHNKINSLDQLENNGWPANIHVIGKDIMRFHSVYWPAMLLSAKLPLPKQIFGHGFLTREGLKMGKSLGNVIDPFLLQQEYGTDPLRWYLLKDFTLGKDGDFKEKRLIEIVNNDLANTIGNLLNRTISMSRKWYSNSVPVLNTKNILEHKLMLYASQEIKNYISAMTALEIQKATVTIINLATNANIYLNDTAPWKSIKQDVNQEIVSNDIYCILDTCRIIGVMLVPLLPEYSKKILSQLSTEISISEWKKNLYPAKLVEGIKLADPTPIINKIDKIIS